MQIIPPLSRVLSRSDTWVGLFFALLGSVVALGAGQFPGEAGRIPLLAAVLLVVLGATLVIKSCVVAPATGIDCDLLQTVILGPLPVVILLISWTYLLAAGYGFIEVSVPMVMGIIYLMGNRQLITNVLCSLVIVGLIFLMFYVGLNVLLPVGLLSTFGWDLA